MASLLSHLSLYLVLLVALRQVGVGEAEVSWAEVLAVFAFARLATAIPFTPGGAGVRAASGEPASPRRWCQRTAVETAWSDPRPIKATGPDHGDPTDR